jgi:hypothetical protein
LSFDEAIEIKGAHSTNKPAAAVWLLLAAADSQSSPGEDPEVMALLAEHKARKGAGIRVRKGGKAARKVQRRG